MFQFGRLVTQVLISSMGTVSIAANSVANTIANYLYMPSTSIQNCAVTVVGRCVGAGEKKQAKKYAKTLLLWDYVSMWSVRVGLAYILSLESITVFSLTIPGAGLGIFGIWIAMIADWVLRAVLFIPHFIKEKWLTQKALM